MIIHGFHHPLLTVMIIIIVELQDYRYLVSCTEECTRNCYHDESSVKRGKTPVLPFKFLIQNFPQKMSNHVQCSGTSVIWWAPWDKSVLIAILS